MAKQKTRYHCIGTHQIEVVQTSRKGSIALKARANNRIVLFVPRHYSPQKLEKVLRSQQQWLKHTLSKLEAQLEPCRNRPVFRGQEGDVLEFLGESKTLVMAPRCTQNEGKNRVHQPYVCMQKRFCLIGGGVESSKQVCDGIQAFMIQAANSYLAFNVKKYALIVGVKAWQVTVKGYKSRWGSCGLEGRIQFNWRLWQAPEWVIDYVIVHELCHVIHRNHSQDFWRLVNRCYPRAQEAKQYLKQQGHRWITFLEPV